MEYTIDGGQLPVLTITLNRGETLITEAGAMSWMSPNMVMTTKGGGFGKVMGRLFSGESLFLNEFTPEGSAGTIALTNALPGSILAIDITPTQGFIAQKSSFLAAQKGVDLSIYFQRKIGSGFFGGEGFIMQKLTGNGKAFIEIDGSLTVKELRAGEKLVVSTGYIAGMDATVTMDIQMVKGAKNMFFGGEGLFNTVVTGPGKVYLQSTPFFELLKRIPHKS